MKTTTPTAPNAQTYALLAAAGVAFVVYGSLVPLHYQALQAAEAAARFRAVCARPLSVESVSDWITNVVLFVPLGFCLMAAFCVDRRRERGLFVFLFVLSFCALLSTAVEFLQLFFPPRVSSLNDMAAETLGGLFGIMAWLAAGERLTAWARRTWQGLSGDRWAVQLLPIYLALLFLIEALPLDLTLRPADLYHKYRAGRIHLVPFTAAGAAPLAFLTKQVWNGLYFLPLGLLLPELRGPIWRSARAWPRVLGAGLAVAALVEFMQLFVESRPCDVTDIIGGTLAVLSGWALRLGWPAASRKGSSPRLDLRWLLLLGWLGVLTVMNWQPFDFSFETTFLQERLGKLPLVPFADYQQATTLHAFEQLLTKVVWWVPLGSILAALMPREVFLPLLLTSLVAVGLEAGQVSLPSRYASVTDVLLESAGAAMGMVLVRRGMNPWKVLIRRNHDYVH